MITFMEMCEATFATPGAVAAASPERSLPVSPHPARCCSSPTLLRDTPLTRAPYGFVQLAADSVTAGVHVWKRSMLLSMCLGTALYGLASALTG